MPFVTPNTPPALAAKITAAGKTFTPSTERAAYTAAAPMLQLYLDLYELDQAKLEKLVEKHHAGESDERTAARQKLAAVYNLVPMIVDMIGGYLFSESPSYDVGTDADLEPFVGDCDGAGTPLRDFVKRSALPLSMVLGHLDVVVENPQAPLSPVLTQADLAAAGKPYLVPVSPLQRINWSAAANGAYNWLRWKDSGNENPDPFANDPTPPESYVTYTAGEPGPTGEPTPGWWLRSFKPTPEQAKALAAQGAETDWVHAAGYAPTARVPAATLYHKRSLDPANRHTGLSKIAMVAVLTKQIVQILGWSAEDIKANLALYCMPSKNGEVPTDPKTGKVRVSELNAYTILWFDREAGQPPMVLQGAVDHIKIKLALVELHLREILRLSNLLAASGTAGGGEGQSAGGKATSGRQAEIERTELHRELEEKSGALDRFVMDVLALVKSWATDSDVTAEDLEADGVKVSHFKGPWVLDSLADVIANTTAAVALFQPMSSTAVEALYNQAARALLYGAGAQLEDALAEIKKNTGAEVERQAKLAAELGQAEVDAAKLAAQPPPAEAA